MSHFHHLPHLKDEQGSHHARRASTATPDLVDTQSEDEMDEDDGRASPPLNGLAKASDMINNRKPHATRRRAVQSCSECRRRKIKCDKK